jgi:hypothetical protein
VHDENFRPAPVIVIAAHLTGPAEDHMNIALPPEPVASERFEHYPSGVPMDGKDFNANVHGPMRASCGKLCPAQVEPISSRPPEV